MKRVIRKIVKMCGTPEDFCFTYVSGAAGVEEGLRRMREYVKCANKTEREFNVSSKIKTTKKKVANRSK